jgi:PAS domain S-box-containing protein
MVIHNDLRQLPEISIDRVSVQNRVRAVLWSNIRAIMQAAVPPTPDAQRKLDAILNNASVAVFVMDASYECVYMNPAAVALSGFTLEETRGRPLHDVVHHTRPDGSHLPMEACPIGQSLETLDTAMGEEVFVHKDGSFYPVAFRAAPMREEDGTLLGTVLEVRDIRQEKATLQALREGDRAKDAFLAMLGHELRNPLSPIVTSLQLMKMRGIEAPELQVIERQVQHLSRLVDDLLDVSRVIRGLLDLRKAPIDGAAVIARSAEIARPLLEGRRQQLVVDSSETPVLLEADLPRLAQVLTNLLVNASKFSPQGTQVTLRCRCEGGNAVIRVQDQGEGIAPEMLERIFEPFVQTAQGQDRPRGGLGLGLAIARNIVALHGGSIRASSAGPGSGAEFTVTLPVATPAVEYAQQEDARTAPASLRPRRILVVDDNRDAADVLQALLEAHGHTVLVAYDAAEALKRGPGFGADVALLDVGLPVMDGYELARRLRESCGPEGPRLVALTGYGQAGDRDRSRQAGFAEHLVKPVEAATLLNLLDGIP